MYYIEKVLDLVKLFTDHILVFIDTVFTLFALSFSEVLDFVRESDFLSDFMKDFFVPPLAFFVETLGIGGISIFEFAMGAGVIVVIIWTIIKWLLDFL